MQKVSSKDGTPIAFDKLGSGPTLILVGGAFQFRAFDQRTGQLAGLLSQHFTVYHYDRRGRGDSGDTQPYAVEREIEDLDALIKDAGESAFVFGHSSGAVLALDAAAYGLAITKLALYEPPFMLEENMLLAAADYTKQLTAVLAEGRRGDAAALAMTHFGTPADAVAGMRASPAWPMFEAVAPTLAYDDAVMDGCAVPTKRLVSVPVPTLVLSGGASPDWMQNAALATADPIPKGRHHTLEGQTHAVAPEILAPALIGFFNAH